MNLVYPEAIEILINELRKFPGVGKRSAERMALSLISRSNDELIALGELISSLPQTVSSCPECGMISQADSICPLCSRIGRDDSVICVVENSTQVIAVENSGHFNGRYLVLGGKISPLDNQTEKDLNIDLLLKKANNGIVKEIILALGGDVEGRATAIFINDLLKDSDVKVTTPALGLPAGGNLNFADSATIGAAFKGRSEI